MELAGGRPTDDETMGELCGVAGFLRGMIISVLSKGLSGLD